MNSLIASVLAAVRPGAEPHSLEEGIMPDAEAPTTETPPLGASTGVSSMTLPNAPAGASASVDLAAAVAAATTGGHADGFKAATDRLGAIMGAEGIKGDGKRMAAALDLAKQSPEMTADAVIGFVTGNIPAASQPAPQQGANASGYEHKRLAAAGLAQPGAAASAAPKANIDRNAIFAARRAAVKEA